MIDMMIPDTKGEKAMKELDISMIQDLNRLFGYTFIIEDGKITRMMNKEDEINYNVLHGFGLVVL